MFYRLGAGGVPQTLGCDVLNYDLVTSQYLNGVSVSVPMLITNSTEQILLVAQTEQTLLMNLTEQTLLINLTEQTLLVAPTEKALHSTHHPGTGTNREGYVIDQPTLTGTNRHVCNNTI